MNSLIRSYKLFSNFSSSICQSEKTLIDTHQLRVRHLQLFSSNADDENKNNQLPKIVIQSTSIAELLNSSCGFPPEEAKAVESRLLASTVKNKKKKKPEDIENARHVIEFFRDTGFSDTHIRKLISLRPNVLRSSVAKTTLKPEEDGARLTNVSSLRLIPAKIVLFFSKYFQSKEDVAMPIRKNSLPPNRNYGRNLEAPISIYLKHGVPKDKLAHYVAHYPKMMSMKPQVIEERIQKAYELGFKHGDGMLMLAVRVIASMNSSTWESNTKVLRGCGWKDDDIVMAFRKAPSFLACSVGKMKRTLKFFMEDLKYEPFHLASHSTILCLSLDKRIAPRVRVVKELESKGLMKRKQSLFTILNRSERQFQKDFLLDIKDEHPELFKSYLKSVQQA